MIAGPGCGGPGEQMFGIAGDTRARISSPTTTRYASTVRRRLRMFKQSRL